MYYPPLITATGIHIPTYQDRLDNLLSSYQNIFGPEANLEPSSPDYQLLSVFARMMDDASQLIVSDFAAHSPSYATGMGLDLLMSLFGLTRAGATYSKVALSLTGTPNAVLPAAPQALDDAGILWSCQTSGIALDASGKATVEAVCSVLGAVEAPVGSVSRLVSPVSGLSSLVNIAAAVPGTDAESDASCRNRLRQAAAAPAVGSLDALRSAILSLPYVTSCVVYENDTDATDARGIPAHSICAVVSGGTTSSVARTLFAKKAPGIGTYGATSATVTDAYGGSHTVRYQRSQSTAAALTIELTPLSGFESSVVSAIRSAMTSYAAELAIGQNIVVPSLYGRIYACDPGEEPTFSVSLLTATAQGVTTSGVLQAAWNQRFTIPASMVQIVIVE